MWQAGSTCYATKTAALQALASSQVGAIVQHGGAAQLVTVTQVGADGIEYTFAPVGGGTPTVQQVIAEPMPCNLLTSDDVSPIVWAIAGGWLAVWAIKQFWQAGKVNDA